VIWRYGAKEIEAWFREEFRKSGKKLDMGKSCVRFKKLEDLPLNVIGRQSRRYRPKPISPTTWPVGNAEPKGRLLKPPPDPLTSARRQPTAG
jgi:hypothetical protein